MNMDKIIEQFFFILNYLFFERKFVILMISILLNLCNSKRNTYNVTLTSKNNFVNIIFENLILNQYYIYVV